MREVIPVKASSAPTREELDNENQKFIKLAEDITFWLENSLSRQRLTKALASAGVPDEEISDRIDIIIKDAIEQVTDPLQENWRAMVQCQPLQFTDAMCKLVEIGVMPNQRLGHGWFNVRAKRSDNEKCENVIVPMPGVRDWEERLCSTGKVASIHSEAVRRQDHYNILEGTDLKIEHRKCITPDLKQPNDVVAAYCVIDLKDGRRFIRTLVVEQKDLNLNRCDPETRARNLAQLKAMRILSQTVGHEPEFKGITTISKLDAESSSMGEELQRPQNVDQPEIVKAEVPDEFNNDKKNELVKVSEAKLPKLNPLTTVLQRIETNNEEVNGMKI